MRAQNVIGNDCSASQIELMHVICCANEINRIFSTNTTNGRSVTVFFTKKNPNVEQRHRRLLITYTHLQQHIVMR